MAVNSQGIEHGLADALLEIVVCPQCHGDLTVRTTAQPEEASLELVCAACSLAYPIRDQIPVLLVDEARPSQ